LITGLGFYSDPFFIWGWFGIFIGMNIFDSKKVERFFGDEHGQWNMPKSSSINLFILYLYIERHFFWVRLFNNWYGISGEKISKKKFRLFSERNGYRKYIKIGDWQFQILKPSPLKRR